MGRRGVRPRGADQDGRPDDGLDGLEPYDVIVLAGGSARRFGGADKVVLPVGGRPMIERVVAAGEGALSTVVVGPERPMPGPVPIRWTREQPAGAGPLAALAAGLALCTAPVVVVLAADMPLLDPTVVRLLVVTASAGGVGEADGVDGAVLVDGTGRRQPLAAAYRRQAVVGVLDAIGDVRDQPMRLLLERLRLTDLPEARAALDCDTPGDLAYADQLAGPRRPDGRERPGDRT